MAISVLPPGSVVRADTTWVAAGSVSGIWTAAGTPYMVYEGDVEVPADSALIIGDGVVIMFTGAFQFQVSGRLQALGTATDSIYFTCDPDSTPGGWRGLRFINADDESEMLYCVVERGRATGAFDQRFGGGVECMGSSPTFTDCTFRFNHANIDGGGVYVRQNSSPVFERCRFEGNNANFGGGGILSRASSHPELIDCVLIGNTALTGGGAHCGSTSDMQLLNCVIDNNTATLGGGFYAEYGTATPALTHCRITGNSADSLGGGLFLKNTDALIRYSVISGNECEQGGGVYVDGSSAIIRNSIISFSPQGSGVHFENNASITIEGCDIFGHSAGVFSGEAPAGFGSPSRQNLNFDSCDVFMNIFQDPQFVDASVGDFHLQEGSPCIAAGVESAGLIVDPDGTERPAPAMTLPDQGIFEHITGAPQQICGSQEGQLGPGTFAVTCNLRVAGNTELLIAPGTSLLFAGDFIFRVYGRLLIDGRENEPILLSRYFDDESQRWGGLEFLGADDDSELNFAIIEYAHIPDEAERLHGGGIYLDNSAPTFASCTIRDCEALGANSEGGGAYSGNGSAPFFSKCTIENNIATLKGGGLSVDASSAVFVNLGRISGNICGFLGGGVFLNQSAATFNGVDILNNHSETRGGGIYSWWSSPVFGNCRIAYNSCGDLGGGIYVNNAAPQFNNCTFSNNDAFDGGGLLLNESSARLKNSIVAYSSGSGLRFDGSNQFAAIEYSNIFGNQPFDFVNIENAPANLGVLSATNFNDDPCDEYLNILLDPQFADTISGEFELTSGSPCINAGDPFGALDQDSSLADQGAVSFMLPYEPSTAFNLVSPPPGHGVDETNLELVWEQSFDEGTDTPVPLYRTQVSTDSLFRFAVQERTTSASAIVYSGLADSTVYWWRVKAIGHNGIARLSNQKWDVYTVEPHPPSPFELLQPEDGDSMLVTESRLFCWQQSEDLDGGDFIVYALNIQTADTFRVFTDLTDTCLNIVPLILGFDQTAEAEWWVEASSNDPDTTIECLNRFQILFQDTSEAADAQAELPREFALHQNFPNPFNATTVLSFDVPVESELRLRILNVLGREVELLVSGRMPAGTHRIHWTADRLASGVYLAVLETEQFRQVRKLMLLK